MKELVIFLHKDLEIAKFGISIPAYANRKAWTENYLKFFVEVEDNSPLCVVVDGFNVDIVSWGK